jgi:glucosamine kinase
MGKSILCGDIGSTKSTWWFGSDMESAGNIRLGGYNPLVQEEKIGQLLVKSLKEWLGHHQPDVLYWYGAGITGPEAANRVKNLLNMIFLDSVLDVTSDLEGAARAVCGHQPGTVAILGTGSHAAVYDGRKISQQANALGYLLGDEGSGCDIGKQLIRAYFQGTMPSPIRETMLSRISGDRSQFLQALYQSSAPNQFLADFATIAAQHGDDPWVKDLVRHGFRGFIKCHILTLPPTGSVHVVGSIGSIFADLMREELHNAGLTPGVFEKDPGYRLFEIHLEHG